MEPGAWDSSGVPCTGSSEGGTCWPLVPQGRLHPPLPECGVLLWDVPHPDCPPPSPLASAGTAVPREEEWAGGGGHHAALCSGLPAGHQGLPEDTRTHRLHPDQCWPRLHGTLSPSPAGPSTTPAGRAGLTPGRQPGGGEASLFLSRLGTLERVTARGRGGPPQAAGAGAPPPQVYAMLLSSFLWFTIHSGRGLDRKGTYNLRPG